ncbi:MAG: copper amine oxidase N-terminal domain-containing protein [Clostridiales bacterium]|nr:copper amine oxidase N-terminal domain-containing protein [Clostridiales bacterium]MCF8023375.1 copper amine oxidase N-terminal domain-containing protein [Clostridiales bacterium]
MINVRNKKIALLTALVFVMTLVLPMSAAFAGTDYVDFGKSYKYVSTGDDVYAGTATATYKDEGTATADDVYFELTLPDGVEFASNPASTGDYAYDTLISENCDTFVSSSSDSLKVVATSWASDGDSVKFDFTTSPSSEVDGGWLDIDDDFAGNLDVTIEATGVENEDIVWAEEDELTIAKVSGDDVNVIVDEDDVKKVSVGGGAEAAEITLEEEQAGALTTEDTVYMEIETSGVSFDMDSEAATDANTTEGIELDQSNYKDWENNTDDTKIWTDVTGDSNTFPGKIEITTYLNIDPDVTGDIEITVESNLDGTNVDDGTFTVATVGDTTAEVTEIDDNDTTVYAGQSDELDVEFTVATTDGSNFSEDDMITFELNKGEFVTDDEPDVRDNAANLYNDDESFYYTFKNTDTDEVDVDNIDIKLDNDVEPGDITLTVGGDYGDMGEVTIGQAALPFTVSADKAEIISEALSQEAGDIIITETEDGAFGEKDEFYFEIPSGVELSSEPSIEVVEGSGDASIDNWDEDYFTVKIDEESTTEPTEFRVYDVEYDAGKLALAGDVELEVRGCEDDDIIDSDKQDNYTDDAVFTTVVNATVADEENVEASFTMGEDGVAIQNGRMLVQVNELCEVLGLQKSWDAANKTAYFVKSGTVVAFPIDNDKLVINGNEIAVDQGGTIIDGSTYATLRGIQMAFGGKLDWNGANKTATFTFSK